MTTRAPDETWVRPRGKGKIVVCRCEDVTLHDVEHSIATGYADIEEIKRYTGFGTGPCQGKECLSVMADLICQLTDCRPDEIKPFTSRQPIAPTPLALLASVELEEREDERPVYAQPAASPGDGDQAGGDGS